MNDIKLRMKEGKNRGESRRKFLKAAVGSSTAFGLITKSNVVRAATRTTLDVTQSYGQDEMNYKIWVDSNDAKKESKADKNDSVSNYSNSSIIKGTVLEGRTDTFSYTGKISIIEVTAVNGTNTLTLTQSNGLRYNGEGALDVYANAKGSVPQSEESTCEFYTTGLVASTGDGSLENTDSASDNHGYSQVMNGDHDHFDINGQFESIEIRPYDGDFGLNVDWGSWWQS